MIDIVRRPGAETDTVDVDVSDDERDPALIVEALAKVLRRR
jgi:hypothetical protein